LTINHGVKNFTDLNQAMTQWKLWLSGLHFDHDRVCYFATKLSSRDRRKQQPSPTSRHMGYDAFN